MKAILPTALVITVLLASSSCGGSKSNTANSPTAPGSTVLLGVWTGTLTRPAGLAPISARWQPTQDSFNLTGPMTLTNGQTSVTITGKGVVGGNDQSGYSIHMSFSSNSGDIPALPNCAIRGNTNGSGTGDSFPNPFNAISTPAFAISYIGCRGFVDTPPPGDFLQETVQLRLNKS